MAGIFETVRGALENDPTEDLAGRIERELEARGLRRDCGRPRTRAGTLRKMWRPA